MALQTMTALLASDGAQFTAEVCGLLAREGAEVLGPTSSIEGTLSLLDKTIPDCAVLDPAVAYETAMRVPKRLNTLGVPYLIKGEEAVSEHDGSKARMVSDDPQKLVEAIGVMLTA